MLNSEILPIVTNIIHDLASEKFNGDYAKQTSLILEQTYGITKSKNAIIGMLRREGLSIATVKRDKKLDLEETVNLFNLEKYNPITYNLTIPKLEYKEVSKILCIGDVHLGSLIDTNGWIHDPVKQMQDKFDILKENFKKAFLKEPFKKLTLILLGDLIDGELIYKQQQAMPVQHQVTAVTGILYDFIQYVREFVDEIQMYGVAGNHGRLEKNYLPVSNWDSVIMYMLQLRYIDDEKVKYRLTDDRMQLVKIENWNFMIAHGKLSKSFDPNKWYSKIQKYKLYKYKDMDGVIIGHWHNVYIGETFNMPVLVNGTAFKSPYVEDDLGGKETLKFLLITVGTDYPVEKVEFLSLEK